jgi:ABC-2 type transport system ATP-binding protein
MPHDAHPDQPDGEREGVRAPGSPVRSLPPAPDVPAADAAAQDPAVPLRAKRPSGKAPGKQLTPDPGPPPPLPSDLVIPPKPPLPVVVGPERDDVVEPGEPMDHADAEEPQFFADDVIEADLVRVVPATAEPVEDEPVQQELVEVASVRVEPESTVTVLPEVLVAASVDPTMAALVVKGVTKAFGETRAVDGIDLTVSSGTFYGLVGPNGAGKTTTLSMIAGLLRPDRGSIRVNGIDAAQDPLGAKRQMGVLPDRLRTFDRLTGRQLLHYYGVLRGLPTAVVESRTADLARAFDLSDALGRVVSDYSAGMLKKVMLAGALIHSPRLLVLDEPFESVDPVSSAIILDILSTYVDHGGTVILSSHGMELVQRVCTRVAVIVAGQVLAEGTVDEVRGELTLEQRFIELAGGLSDVEGLEWLHTFSD